RFQLIAEITEDEYLDDQGTLGQLNALSELGIGVAIDDFGTGYSNLKQLKQLSCDYLKIDRSFVIDIQEESIKSSLIPRMVDIAEQLGLSVIAEGIEHPEQQHILAEMGVQYGQGWALGKPMTARELVQCNI